MLAYLKNSVVLVFAIACGGGVSAGDAGPIDGAMDGGTDSSSICAQNGESVCGGPNACACSGFCTANGNGDLGICDPADSKICALADDGFVCVNGTTSCNLSGKNPMSCWAESSVSLGELFAQNGGADRVRYEDMGSWTGEALPTQTSCPTLTTAQVCGPACTPCSSGTYCHGRSPLHPFGACLPIVNDVCIFGEGILCSDAANKCFRYHVQPEAQPIADLNSLCLPKALCDDLAANLPGGGYCD